MAKLPKFTLTKDEKTGKWPLKNDATDQIVKTFKTKASATTSGVLAKAVGPEGGSVKIKKQNGHFDEERTYPRSKDPKTSKG